MGVELAVEWVVLSNGSVIVTHQPIELLIQHNQKSGFI